MNFETYMLRGLFVACFAVSALIMGAMLTTRPPPAPAASSAVTTVFLSAPSSCVMRPDGVVCPLQHG